jgi:nucleoside-diphosphate-sugar epimerase
MILLFGATGQIGAAIAKHLQQPHKALYRTVPGTEAFDWMKLDTALNNHNADTVIFTPHIWCLPEYLPHLTTIKRLIIFSSTSIFGKANSSNPYEQNIVTKLLNAERTVIDFCNKHQINYTIFRPTLCYGMGRDKNVTVISKFVQRFGFFPLPFDATGLRQPVHVYDLAIATIAALDTPSAYNQAYNLGGGETLTYQKMVERIFISLHKTPHIIRIPFFGQLLNILGFITLRPHINSQISDRMKDDLVFDYSEATRDFNYEPRGFL